MTKNSRALSIFISFLLFFQVGISFLLLFKYGTVFQYNTWDDLRGKINLEGYWKFIIINYIWLSPVTVSLSAFLYFLSKKYKNYSFILLKLNFLVALVNIILSIAFGYRSFIITSVLLILLTLNILQSLSEVKFILASVILFLLYVVLTFFKSLSFIKDNPVLFFDALFHRILFEGYKSLNYIIYYIDEYGFQFGRTYVIDLATKLPGRQDTFSKILGNMAGFREGIGMNVTLVGDLYVNWHLLGFVVLFLLGFVYVYLEYIFLRKFLFQKRYFYLIMYSILYLSAYNLILGGISTFFDVLMQIIVASMLFVFYTGIKQMVRGSKNCYEKSLYTCS